MMRIGVFTSTRADFGILRPLVLELTRRSSSFEVELFVTGTHLMTGDGNTLREIEEAGFHSLRKVGLFGNSEESESEHSLYMSVGLKVFSRELSQAKYDLAVVLGDRYETLAFALACFNQRLPVVHIHGGEVTRGALDDGYRHCITKLSHIHFPCDELYANRIVRMGENPKNVFNVGALAWDNIRCLPVHAKSDLEKRIGRHLNENIVTMTFHPETMSADHGVRRLENIIESLRAERFKDWSLVVTGVNRDQGSESIRQKFIEWGITDSRVIYVESLGAEYYFSMVRQSVLVVGNSSSGVLEVPILGIPVVNVGSRQEGRIRSGVVLDVLGDSSQEILRAIDQALEIRKKNILVTDKLDISGSVSSRMADILEKVDSKNIFEKVFYDDSL